MIIVMRQGAAKKELNEVLKKIRDFGYKTHIIHGVERDAIFSGDAAKNRAEMLGRAADMSYDPALTAASIDMIWKFWRARPGNILVPGHDLPMVLEPDGTTR